MIKLRAAPPFIAAARLLRSQTTGMLESRFVRHVAVLVGGTTVSRVMLVAAAPILTRIYHPADFGAFAVFFSIVSVAVMASAYNYEQAIAVPKEDQIAAGLVVWCFTLLMINVALSSIAVVFFPSQLDKLLGAQSITHFLWLVPLSLLGGGTFYILNSWAIRKASFKSLSKRRIWQSAAQILVQVAVPLVRQGPLGLLLGDSVGRMAGSTTLLREMRGHMKEQGVQLSFRDGWIGARRYWKYPAYGLPALLLHTGLTTLPPLLLTRYYGLAVAGSYSLVNQVVGVGTSFIGLAVAQVYFHKAAALSHSDPSRMLGLFLKTSGICAAIALLPYACLGLFGPMLFKVVFGHAWIEAGQYGQLLAIPYFFVFVVGPVFPVLTILQRQNWQLLIDGLGLVLLVALILTVVHLQLGARYAIGAYGVALSLTYCGLYGAAGLAVWQRRKTFRATPDRVSGTLDDRPLAS
jgi:O-antigen/teichoic acid export membrane protein